MTGISNNVVSQEESGKGITYVLPDSNIIIPSLAKEFNQGLKAIKPEKIKFGLDLGSNFSYGKGFGSVFNNYIAPRATLTPTKKLNLSIGTMFMVSSMPGNLTSGENQIMRSLKSYSSAYIYGSGEYLINDNLSLRGTILYELNPFNPFNETQNTKSMNSYYYSMGMDYKIKDGIYIGIEVSQMKSDNPLFIYNTPGYGSFRRMRHPFDY